VREGLQALAAVLKAAEHTDGIFTVDDAARKGLHSSSIGRLVSDGILERVAPGHVRGSHLRWTLSARQRQALVYAGSDSVLAARSALHWQRVGPRPETIELLIPRGRRQQRPAVRVIQSTDIVATDVTTHLGLATSTPTRALIDAARFLSPLALGQAVSECMSVGLVDLDKLDLRFREIARRGRPGVRRVRACLATFGTDPLATDFERDLERIIERGGFITPVRQYRVKVGTNVYFLDHCWPEQKKWSECDSMLAHGSAEALRQDLERQNRIIAATGFEPMRFTYFDVHQRPDYVSEILRKHLPRRVVGEI